jgi:hypothetical protein
MQYEDAGIIVKQPHHAASGEWTSVRKMRMPTSGLCSVSIPPTHVADFTWHTEDTHYLAITVIMNSPGLVAAKVVSDANLARFTWHVAGVS